MMMKFLLGWGVADKASFIERYQRCTSGAQRQWLEQHTAQWGIDGAVG